MENTHPNSHDTTEQRAATAYGDLHGVVVRRCYAYLFDMMIIIALSIVMHEVVFLFGFVALSLTWILFGSLFPIAGILYSGLTVGGPWNATWGMRFFRIEVREIDGRAPGGWFAAAHAALFYLSFLVPPVFFIPFLSPYRRCLHDIAIGAIVVRL